MDISSSIKAHDSSLPSSASGFLTPIISKGKGKTKFFLNDEDVPISQRKRLKHVPSLSTSSLSKVEFAAFSLTALQEDSSFIGPIQNFLHSPLVGHDQHVNKMPNPGCAFATEPQSVSAVQGVVPILQISSQQSTVTDLPQEFPTPMVIHRSPTPLSAYQGRSPRRFYRAARETRRNARGSDVSSLVHTTTEGAMIPQPNLEKSPVRPPPQP